jgi:hypothetical protein
MGTWAPALKNCPGIKTGTLKKSSFFGPENQVGALLAGLRKQGEMQFRISWNCEGKN